MNPHPQVLEKLTGMTYSQARRYLKRFCTHAEQDDIIRRVKLRPDGKGWLAEYLAKPHEGPVPRSFPTKI